MAVGFFNPTCPFTISGFTLQSSSPSQSWQRAQALDATGDEAASTMYGGQESNSFTFRGAEETGSFGVGSLVGSVSDGYHCDSVSVSWSTTDHPELTVSSHKHLAGNASHGTAHRQPTGALANLPHGFGTCGWNTLLNLPTDATVSSATYNLGVTHEDAPDCSGDYLASENRDGVETLTFECTGNVAKTVFTAVFAAADGWDVTSYAGPTRSNTGAETTSITLERHLATTSAASSSAASSSES